MSLERQPKRIDQMLSAAERIVDFADVLEEAPVQTINPEVNMSSLNPARDAVDEFMASYNVFEPSLLLRPEFAQLVKGAPVVGFEPYVSSQQKNEGSRIDPISGHGVFFGALILEDGNEIEIAVKPHHIPGNTDESDKRRMARSCVRDYYTNVAAHQGGFEGILPIGFLLNPNGTPYSLTLLNQEMSTFDTVDWRSFFSPGFETEGMRDMWDKAAMRVAVLHDMGMSSHNDLYPRNFGATVDGHVDLIDWEKGNVTNNNEVDLKKRFKLTKNDIKDLMEGMVKPENYGGIAMFAANKGDWWEDFKDVFLSLYVEARLSLAEESHQKGRVKEVAMELYELQDHLRIEMMMMQDDLQPLYAQE